MANPTVDDVETLVVFSRQQETLEQALGKFQGRRTPKTLAAARRLVSKRKQVKVPRNLLRQLFRATGGWQLNQLRPGWAQLTPAADWKRLQFGDLVVGVSPVPSGYTEAQYPASRSAVLSYRGRKVAHIAGQWSDGQSWLSGQKLAQAVKAVGTPWTTA